MLLLIGPNFYLRNYYFWIVHRSTYLHKETNGINVVSKISQKYCPISRIFRDVSIEGTSVVIRAQVIKED